MLFPYVYSPHSMEQMHEYIEYIFEHVWCTATQNRPFELALFRGNDGLYHIMEDIWQQIDVRQQPNTFWDQVEGIYFAFAKLSSSEIEQIRLWFVGNNNIEGACANLTSVSVVKYAQLKAFTPELGKLLEKFFKGLYDDHVLDRKRVQETITTINEHYRRFVELNNADICPFCGLEALDGQYEETRDAYDHYLPKSLYPFNSINFHNLVPACTKCNSRSKKTKDPLHTSHGARRKAFYPFLAEHSAPSVSVELNCKDYTLIQKDDILLQFFHNSGEELETWKDLYNIEERYKAHCCSQRSQKDWLVSMDAWMQSGQSPEDYLAVLTAETARAPFAGCRFLKLSFLQACNKINLFADFHAATKVNTRAENDR